MGITSTRYVRVLISALATAAISLAGRTATAEQFLAAVDLEDGSATGPVPGLDGASAAAVSPDGLHVYVTSDADDSIVLFDRNPDGTLDFVTQYKNGLGGFSGLRAVKDVTSSHDGATVYTASLQDDTVAVHARNPLSGALTFVEKFVNGVGLVECIDNSETVVVSPDDECVYATGRADDAVATFDRNPANGRLTYLSCHRDGIGGVDGLDDPGDITLSPDGSHVYVTGSGTDSVAIFGRTPPACGLTFIGSIADDDLEEGGLDRPEGLVVSPDGAHLYVASAGDDAVVVFDRDGGTGALTLVEVDQNRHSGFSGLDGARSITASPSGEQIFVGSSVDETIVTLSRDVATGRLSMVQSMTSGVNGVALAGMETNAIALSQDAASLYAAATTADSVNGFELLSTVDCPATPTPGCRVPTKTRGAALKLVDRDGTRLDGLSWKWSRGELTTIGDFGDTASTTSHALCIYDSSGPGSTTALVSRSNTVPGACRGRPCWRELASGLKYNAPHRGPDGVDKIIVKQGLDGKARITLKAKGDLVNVPSLPLALPVTVQFLTAEGECWESLHGSAKRNEPVQFKAVSD